MHNKMIMHKLYTRNLKSVVLTASIGHNRNRPRVDAALAIQVGTGEDSMDAVKDGGKVITVSGDKVDSERNIIVQQFQHQLDIQQAIGNLVEDIAAGKIHLVIEHVFSFDQALDALKKTETRHARGKLVVSMTEA